MLVLSGYHFERIIRHQGVLLIPIGSVPPEREGLAMWKVCELLGSLCFIFLSNGPNKIKDSMCV